MGNAPLVEGTGRQEGGEGDGRLRAGLASHAEFRVREHASMDARYQCLSMYKVNSRNLCIRDNVIRLPAGSVVPRFEHPATMLSNKGNSSDAASTVFGAC